MTPSGRISANLERHRSSQSFRLSFNSSLSIVSHNNGVARPWAVTRFNARVDWLSMS